MTLPLLDLLGDAVTQSALCAQISFIHSLGALQYTILRDRELEHFAWLVGWTDGTLLELKGRRVIGSSPQTAIKEP